VPASPPLPAARGPVSRALVATLRRAPGTTLPPPSAADLADPWGDDVQLALYLTFELGYRGFAGVDPGWESDPGLVDTARALRAAFLAAVRDEVGTVTASSAGEARDALVASASGDGPSLSRWIADRGTLEHLRELAAHRSAYQLKEADPHSLALPRLPAGRAKAAFVEIQADEYGNGEPGESHQELFASTLRALDLDDRYGALLDLVPAATLATVNLLSLFGSSRAHLGACVGHLALFEMTSVGPMGRYAAAVRRLTGSETGARFYDVHVLADQHHQRLALDGLVVPFVADDPALAADVVFGARALGAVEGRFTAHVVDCWERGVTSLRRPLARAGTTAAA